jgi:hypothetical protein
MARFRWLIGWKCERNGEDGLEMRGVGECIIT